MRARVRASCSREAYAMLALAVGFLPFALAMSITPGPNNVMVASSGATFGFRRTLPHMLGITCGAPVMLVAVGMGLGELFRLEPRLHEALKYLGAAFLLYLAWRIARSTPKQAKAGQGAVTRPIGFLTAAAFQWVNPKAWSICIGAVSTYTTIGGEVRLEVMVLGATLALACFPSVAIWTGFGVGIGRLLAGDPRRLRLFNGAMALLLALSVLLLFL